MLIAVRDASAAQPVPACPASDDESGRGLLIVDALAATWDVKLCPGGGKTVRFWVPAGALGIECVIVLAVVTAVADAVLWWRARPRQS